MLYSTIVYTPAVFACIDLVTKDLTKAVKHTSEKNMSIAATKNMIVVSSCKPINDIYQEKMKKSFDVLVGENNYIVKFNQRKPNVRYDYVKYF